MAEKNGLRDERDTFEVNPDGADLDGTAEIERQQEEQEKRRSDSKVPGATSQPPAALPNEQQKR